MTKNQRKHSPSFKARVALKCHGGLKTESWTGSLLECLHQYASLAYFTIWYIVKPVLCQLVETTVCPKQKECC